jgi:hypothetical protein
MKTNILESLTKLFANAGVYTGLLMIYINMRGLDNLNVDLTKTKIIENIESTLLPIFIGGYFIFAFLLGKPEFRLNYLLIFILLILTISIFEFAL